MTLVACPECSTRVSDQAMSCVHCGYPMKREGDPPVNRSREISGIRTSTGNMVEGSPEKSAKRWADSLTNRQVLTILSCLAFPYGILELGKYAFLPIAETTDLQAYAGILLVLPGLWMVRARILFWLWPFGFYLLLKYQSAEIWDRQTGWVVVGIMCLVLPLAVNFKRVLTFIRNRNKD